MNQKFPPFPLHFSLLHSSIFFFLIKEEEEKRETFLNALVLLPILFPSSILFQHFIDIFIYIYFPPPASVLFIWFFIGEPDDAGDAGNRRWK